MNTRFGIACESVQLKKNNVNEFFNYQNANNELHRKSFNLTVTSLRVSSKEEKKHSLLGDFNVLFSRQMKRFVAIWCNGNRQRELCLWIGFWTGHTVQ